MEDRQLYFRAVLSPVEYKLDLELWGQVEGGERLILSCKGGEVLITMFKTTKGEIWPRLLATEDRCPYINIDFTRWVAEFPMYNDSKEVSRQGLIFWPIVPLLGKIFAPLTSDTNYSYIYMYLTSMIYPCKS